MEAKSLYQLAKEAEFYRLANLEADRDRLLIRFSVEKALGMPCDVGYKVTDEDVEAVYQAWLQKELNDQGNTT